MRSLFVINCFGWQQRDMSFTDLLVFTALSTVFITILLFYYNKISNKGNGKADLLNIATYNSKDIFSQDIVGDSNFVLTEKVTSIWVRVTIYIAVFIIATTSMLKLLTNDVIEYTIL